MRYNLESTLPINAFSPRGGRNPFARGMTLEGGGGGGVGNVLKPVTGALGSVAKGITQGVKGIVQPIYNATLKNIPGVDNALVQLDKSVGKAIPGGWGTVASVASSFIPGSQLALMGMTKAGLATGLGALSGSGVMRGKNEFNLQGAIMGGALAYGASQFAEGLQNAAEPATNATTKAIEESAKAETANIASNLGVSGASTAPGSQAAMLAQQNAGFGAEGLKSISSGANTAIQAAQSAGATLPGASNFAYNAAGEMVPANISADITGAVAPTTVVPQPTGLQALGTNLAEAGKGTLSNIADAGQGIKNLTGFGEPSVSSAFSAFKEPISQAGVAAGLVGFSGMAALEEQQKYLDQQAASGAMGNAEYAAAKAKIDEQVARARETVAANPLQTSADTSGIAEGPSLYAKKASGFDTLYDKEPTGGSELLYAMGGDVVANTPDDQTHMASGTPMNNFDRSGVASMIGNTVPQQMYAAGGIASGRFLSGGGDGMSDSIKANINGSQEARLADGEFVVPADVVSHIGNGSSKAGAKQLYSMMDRVRQARVGTKKQGKQINPRKYLAA